MIDMMPERDAMMIGACVSKDEQVPRIYHTITNSWLVISNHREPPQSVGRYVHFERVNVY